jgi:hypothetical protein
MGSNRKTSLATGARSIFVAGAGVSRPFCHKVIRWFNEHGFQAFDWTQNPGWDNPKLSDPVRDALEDIGAVSDAAGVVWILGRDHSHGAPFEVGTAFGFGIPVVILMEPGVEFAEVKVSRIYANLFPVTNHPYQANIILRRCEKLALATSWGCK